MTDMEMAMVAQVVEQKSRKAVAIVLGKIRAEIEQEIAYKPMEMWDYRMGLTKALEIIDKYRTESEVRDADSD